MVHKMRLFDSLIYNVDRNARNMFVTDDFRIWLIDHSRSFRKMKGLREPEKLDRFSRSLLEGIKGLNEEWLVEVLDRYLTIYQIRTILERRDLLVELAEKRIAELGEEKVLYD